MRLLRYTHDGPSPQADPLDAAIEVTGLPQSLLALVSSVELALFSSTLTSIEERRPVVVDCGELGLHCVLELTVPLSSDVRWPDPSRLDRGLNIAEELIDAPTSPLEVCEPYKAMSLPVTHYKDQMQPFSDASGSATDRSPELCKQIATQTEIV